MGPVGGRGRRVALLIALAIATLGLSETARAAGWGPELELRNGPITFPTATHVDRDSNATVISTDFLGPFSTFSVSVSRLGDDGALHNVFRTDSAAVDAYSTFGALARSDIDSGGQVNKIGRAHV